MWLSFMNLDECIDFILLGNSPDSFLSKTACYFLVKTFNSYLETYRLTKNDKLCPGGLNGVLSSKAGKK